MKKPLNQKISMITCYDFSFAKILNETNVDWILVGDSAAMTMHGFENTLHATPQMMCMHTAAVSKGAPAKKIIADMPFLSFRKGRRHAAHVAGELLKAGASAIKIENTAGHEDVIEHLVQSGIPVMGHLGLTPQYIQTLGGHKVQGKLAEDQKRILDQALLLQKLGCFSLVLECVPTELGQKVTEALEIPTIGIGAGVFCDGQVLVLQDLLGMNPDFHPHFLRQFSELHQIIIDAVNRFHGEVVHETFPSDKESYHVKK